MAQDAFDPVPIFSWLAEAGLSGLDLAGLLQGFSERLDGACGRVARGHLTVATVHPMFRAQSLVWRRGEGLDRQHIVHGGGSTATWARSPFRHMLVSKIPLLRVQLQEGPPSTFPVLARLREEGFTEWLGRIDRFHWSSSFVEGGQIGLLTSWTSEAPEGFGEAEPFGTLQTLAPAFAAAVKNVTLAEMAQEVLAAYVGRDAATRVLDGAITRGTITHMQAVLLFADLRGFTRLAASRPTEEVVGVLNRTFEAVADPITSRGGQVLKFMGDGLLAVFLLGEGRETSAVADAALGAARQAQAGLRAAALPLALDMALHLGEVHYGNIGAADRLDFTVIGAAVNEVARLETLCEPLDAPVLVSAALRDAAGAMAAHLVPLGTHALRGIDGERAVYALPADEATDRARSITEPQSTRQ